MAFGGFLFAGFSLLQQLLGTTTGLLATLLSLAFFILGGSAASGYLWVRDMENQLARLEREQGRVQ